MMKILLVILFITISNPIGATPIIYKNHNVFPNSSSHHNPQNRFRRATDEEFSTSVNQMQMIARITNGIYLQQKLIEGTIPSDELISELFNFGTVTPSKLNGIQTDNLKKVVQGIQDLPDKLKVDAEIIRMENRMLALSNFVKISNQVESLAQPSNEYLTAVTALKSVKVNWDDTKNYVLSLSALYKGRGTAKTVNPNEAFTVGALFDNIKRALQTLIDENLEHQETLLASDVLRQSESILVPLFDFHESVMAFSEYGDLLSYKSTVDDGLLESVGTNMNELATVIKDVTASLSSFEDLNQIFVSRHHRNGNADLVHTSGFPNGFSEIDIIFDDLKNQWTQEAIDGQAVHLEKALGQLRTISTKSRELDDSVGPRKDERAKTVSNIVTRLSMFSKVDTAPGSVAEKLKDIQAAATDSGVLPKNFKEYDKLNEQLALLHNQLKAYDAVFSVSKQLRLPENVEKMTNLVTLTTYVKNNELAGKLDELKQSQDFVDIGNIVQGIENSLDILTNHIDVTSPASDIVEKFKELAPYIKDSGKFLTMLTTLRGIEELESIEPVVTLIKKCIALQHSPLGDFEKVTDSIGGIKEKLNSLESLIKEMKGFNSAETNVLIGLNDVSKNSEVIGSATRGISNMKNALNDKADIKKMNAIGRLVHEEMAKVTLDSDDVTNLETFVDLGEKLKTVYDELENFKKAVSTSTSSKLSDHVGIFTEANNVQGIDGDIMKMSVSVEKLAVEIQVTDSKNAKLLREIIPALKKLDRDGLKFSKHSTAFDNSNSALDSLDLFFANYAKKNDPKVSPKVPSSPPNGPPKVPSGNVAATTGATVGASEASKTEPEPDSPASIAWWLKFPGLWVPISVIVVSLAIGATISIKWWIRKKKNEKNLNEEQEEDANEDKNKDKGRKKSKDKNRKTTSKDGKKDTNDKKDDKGKKGSGSNSNSTQSNNSRSNSGSSGSVTQGSSGTPGTPKTDGTSKNVPKVSKDTGTSKVKAVDAIPKTPIFKLDFVRRALPILSNGLLSTHEQMNSIFSGNPNTITQKLHRLYEDSLNKLEPAESDVYKVNQNYERQHGPLISNTRCIINPTFFGKHAFINGNIIAIPTRHDLAVMEGPMSHNGYTNAAMMFRFIKDNKIGEIYMLDDFSETSEIKCFQYFSMVVDEELVLEKVTVKCVSFEEVGNEEHRVLEFTFDGKEWNTVKHCKYLGWNETSQEGLDSFLNLLRRAGQREGKIIVHCSGGVSRSGCFAFIELIIGTLLEQSVKAINEQTIPTIQEIFTRLRGKRSTVVTNWLQFAFCIYATIVYICQGHENDSDVKALLDRMKTWYEYHVIVPEAREKQEGSTKSGSSKKSSGSRSKGSKRH